MKKSVVILTVGVLLAVVAVGGMAMKRRSEPAKNPAIATATAAPKTLELAASDLIAVAPREMRRTLPLTGQLRPSSQAVVRAKVAGEIVEMKVREGQAVKAGDVLARLEAADYKARVDE